MGQKLNRAELAAYFGVSLPTIDRWRRDGMPVEKHGSRGVETIFDSAEVTKWYGDRRARDAAGDSISDMAEIERRTKMAKMLQEELALEKARGEVAPVREFERATAALMAAIRANVRNVPGRAVLQLLGCTDEAEFKAKLMAELDLALVTSAEADLDLGDEDEDEGIADGDA